ncbi:MAG TPA: amidohydrolase family protein [Myxococcales bacterium]|jgi:imidazolonepropionase-like amidohydrolase|nr:amidohydrolase family protein [Myxococcales bacterium]
MLLALLVAVDAALQPYVKMEGPLVLEHVRVIDGTGAPPREDQTLFIAGGKLAAQAPAGAQRVDLAGRTVMPGLVGMHDHLFYPMGGAIFGEMAYSFPRLYLAAGVTTIRTAGSIEPYTDLEVKRAIDSGKAPGPTIWISGPYLEGQGSFAVQMHALRDPDDARKFVNFWADQGATSFKAYNTLTRAELGAAIEAAHKRRLKVTAHLCSIGFTEAAQLGIDDLEHGLLVDTEFFGAKKPDQCPNPREALADLAKMDPADRRLSQLIAELVKRKVAITSTLAVFDAFTEDGFRRALTPAVLEAVSGDTRARLLQAHISRDPAVWRSAIKLEMAFERAFAEAGGLLMAGCDPTGNGAVLAGYGDWRDVELLVDAGFTPLQALKIHSLNGATWLGQQDRIGSIAPGKDADLVVVHGDPSKNVADIEKVEIVFKQGVGYDSQKLFESVRGIVGMR